MCERADPAPPEAEWRAAGTTTWVGLRAALALAAEEVKNSSFLVSSKDLLNSAAGVFERPYAIHAG